MDEIEDGHTAGDAQEGESTQDLDGIRTRNEKILGPEPE